MITPIFSAIFGNVTVLTFVTFTFICPESMWAIFQMFWLLPLASLTQLCSDSKQRRGEMSEYSQKKKLSSNKNHETKSD